MKNAIKKIIKCLASKYKKIQSLKFQYERKSLLYPNGVEIKIEDGVSYKDFKKFYKVISESKLDEKLYRLNKISESLNKPNEENHRINYSIGPYEWFRFKGIVLKVYSFDKGVGNDITRYSNIEDWDLGMYNDKRYLHGEYKMIYYIDEIEKFEIFNYIDSHIKAYSHSGNKEQSILDYNYITIKRFNLLNKIKNG